VAAAACNSVWRQPRLPPSNGGDGPSLASLRADWLRRLGAVSVGAGGTGDRFGEHRRVLLCITVPRAEQRCHPVLFSYAVGAVGAAPRRANAPHPRGVGRLPRRAATIHSQASRPRPYRLLPPLPPLLQLPISAQTDGIRFHKVTYFLGQLPK
jgi:hypothetical protein